MDSIESNERKTDTSDIKLWLDYLGKLKDRTDRTNQVTGITTWVLYG